MELIFIENKYKFITARHLVFSDQFEFSTRKSFVLINSSNILFGLRQDQENYIQQLIVLELALQCCILRRVANICPPPPSAPILNTRLFLASLIKVLSWICIAGYVRAQRCFVEILSKYEDNFQLDQIEKYNLKLISLQVLNLFSNSLTFVHNFHFFIAQLKYI